MPTLFFRYRFPIALAVGIALLFSACKKAEETYVANIFEQYFEQNILNRDFIVNFAKDRGTVITDQYAGYTFKLFKNTYYDGPMTAVKGTDTLRGTWGSTPDYGKLIIQITQPASPDMTFINRDWRFAEKALPIMKLAPWGSSEDSELYMERR